MLSFAALIRLDVQELRSKAGGHDVYQRESGGGRGASECLCLCLHDALLLWLNEDLLWLTSAIILTFRLPS